MEEQIEKIDLQYAINKVGLLKVLWASFASAVTKLFGKRGVFYKIVGQEVSGLDGFYDHVWSEYRDIGIENPAEPDKVCNEIKEKIEQSRQQVALYTQRLKGLSPMERLQAGYAFVTTFSGHVVKQIQQVNVGEELQVEITDGTIITVVKQIKQR